MSLTGHSLPGTAGSAVEAAFHDERLARAIHRNSWRQGDAETNVGAVKELGWSLQRISVGKLQHCSYCVLYTRVSCDSGTTLLVL